MERVLLTGASGMVGSHVLRYLLKETDHEFVVVCGWSHKGEPDNLKWAMEGHEDRVKVLTHDLSVLFTPNLKAQIGQVDHIINIASDSHVDRSITDPVDFVKNNVNLALTTLEFARSMNLKRIYKDKGLKSFIQFSTDEVYGAAHRGENHKEWSPIIPSNPYAASKAAQEAIATSYWRTYGVPVIITNTMNVFSPRQDWEKFIPLCVDKVLKGEKITIHSYPGAEQAGSRFYIHADSVAEAIKFILDKGASNYPDVDMPDRYNIVGDREVSNLEVAQKVAEILDKPLNYELVDFHSSRPGHDARYALDGEKLAKEGWQPTGNFDKRFEEVIRELARKHEDTSNK